MRRAILYASFLLSLALYGLVIYRFDPGILRVIRLEQWYGLVGIGYLYLALLIGPLTGVIPSVPYASSLRHARRAIGVSAAYFSLLHSGIAFFGQLGGFAGLFFFPSSYLLSIGLGFLALLILCLMASLSTDWAIKRLTYPRWKGIQRLVYLAALALVVHVLMLGTHYSDLKSRVGVISVVLLAVLLILEARRLDAATKGIASVSVWILIGMLAGRIFWPGTRTASVNIHADHIADVKDAMHVDDSGAAGLRLSLRGDPLTRYTVHFSVPEKIAVGKKVTLQLRVSMAQSGNPVSIFNDTYGHDMHLIIVDSRLQYFSHLVADRDPAQGLRFETTFPRAGTYRLYAIYQPTGAIEQLSTSVVTVGEGREDVPVAFTPDSLRAKDIGPYRVSLPTQQALHAQELLAGKQLLEYHVTKRANSGTSAVLHPYLNAFGHLYLINQETYELIHAHPTDLQAPDDDRRGGPNISFIPLGLTGKLSPGIYRVFAEFAPEGKALVVEHTLSIL